MIVLHRREITIETTPSWTRFLQRTISTILFIPTPIAVGFYYDSVAAQFIGMFLGFILLLALVMTRKEQHTVSSFADARTLIDYLERTNDVPPMERT